MNSNLRTDVRSFLLSIGESGTLISNLQDEDFEQHLSSKAHTCSLMGKSVELKCLLAKVIASNLGDLFEGAFIPADSEIELTSEPCKKYEVFMWCDEVYIVGREKGGWAEVYYFDGSLASNDWRWCYQGEQHFKVGRVTEEFFNEIREKYLAS